MSDETSFDIGKLMPGFDFLRQLAGSGGAASGMATGLGHWVAPTINVEELEQRITELKAVQFWLEQNLFALKATIQALEVQKMTLVALHGMNVGVGEIAKAFTLPEAAAESESPPAAAEGKAGWPYGRQDARASRAPAAEKQEEAEAADGQPEDARAQAPAPRASGRRAPAAAPASATRAAVTDPMQWWGALTQQFQQIAAEAMREAAQALPTAAEAAPAPASKRTRASTTRPAARKKAAARKTAGRKTAARKAAPRKKAADEEPAPTPETGLAGWPLPPAFKPRAR